MAVAGRCTVVAMQNIDGWVGAFWLVFGLGFFTVLGIFALTPYWEPAVFFCKSVLDSAD